MIHDVTPHIQTPPSAQYVLMISTNKTCVLQALIEAAERNAGLRQASKVLGEVIEDDDAGWQRERSQVERDRVRLITISP